MMRESMQAAALSGTMVHMWGTGVPIVTNASIVGANTGQIQRNVHFTFTDETRIGFANTNPVWIRRERFMWVPRHRLVGVEAQG